MTAHNEDGWRSPVELVEASLARIDTLDGSVGAFSHLLRERALATAGAADRASAAGAAARPLDGFVMGVKDNIDTAGCPTTAGLRSRLGAMPESDAPVVARLEAAGAVVVGKTTMHELAFGGTSQNAGFGPCRNPWDLARTPSGSSGGSAAAVAADMVTATLGTDTGGSVRNPAAVTGVTGLRPTDGLVSTRGVVPLSWTLDTVGVIARRAEDVARVLDATAGFDAQDVRSRALPAPDCAERLGRPIGGVRIGLPRAFFFEALEPGIEAAVRSAAALLSDLGVELVEVETPGAESVFEATRPLLWAEGYAAVGDALRHGADDLPARVRARLEGGALVSGPDYALARHRVRAWRRTVASVFDDVDAVLTPATAATAPTAADCEVVEDTRQVTRLSFPWSLSGGPSLSFPCGFDGQGLPIGAHLAGRPSEDHLLLRLAAQYQAATAWHLLRPDTLETATHP